MKKMERHVAFDIALRRGSPDRRYAAAIDRLVKLAVRSSTGHGARSRSSIIMSPFAFVRRTRPEYIIAAPDRLESIAIDPRREGSKDLLEHYRGEDRTIIPYRYSAVYDEGEMTVARGWNLADKLCECLHEKRHARKKEGGLDKTRLDRNYFERDRSRGDRVGEAGLIEEAACDAMAEYDMLVLSNLTKDPELKRFLRNEVSRVRRIGHEQRKLIESRKAVLAELLACEGDWPEGRLKGRLLLLEFGALVAQTEEEQKLYERLERAVGAGKERKASAIKMQVAELMAERQPESAALLLRGNHDLEEWLHCKMAHYSNYTNDAIEPLVRELLARVAPAPADVAAGRIKNPFIDFIGIHADLEEIRDSLWFAEKIAPYGKARLVALVEAERVKLGKKRGVASVYEGLRHLYLLIATARRKGIDIQHRLAPLASAHYTRRIREDVRALLSVYLHHGIPHREG